MFQNFRIQYNLYFICDCEISYNAIYIKVAMELSKILKSVNFYYPNFKM